MNKLFNLNIVIAGLGIICLILFLTPAFSINTANDVQIGMINGFEAAFGTTPTLTDWAGSELTIVASGGLMTGIIILIVSIVLAAVKPLFKGLGFLAGLGFITSAILLFVGTDILKASNYNAGVSPSSVFFELQGWPIAIGVILCVVGAIAIIDTLLSFSKK